MSGVSVVVPVHRAEAHIEECIDAIAAQTLPPLEVVLVDDHGGDSSVELAVARAVRHGLPHRVVRAPHNLGPGGARNLGVARSRGAVVWFCDCDDSADPAFLQTLVDRLLADDSTVAVCDTLLFGDDGAGAWSRAERSPAASGVVSGEQFARDLLADRAKGYSCNKVFRREALRPFAEGVAYEDLDAMVAVALAADRVSLVAEPLYRYRVRGDSLSRVFSTRTLDLVAQSARVDVLLRQHGEPMLPESVEHRYANVVVPLANMAARARGAHPVAPTALHHASRLVRLRDLPTLLRARRWQLARAALVLRISARAYAAAVVRR
ncbi:glycosyltransferase family 2 protein [Nocardioides alcanivorans]|uniref:glycosyltransferase family 2 protein n=1 Tax=Nocardioides alcanivorans TaxID=2897352 RepID=UPI001F231A48|nr:glycosyltransferase [Nocardioides alcanivorans]